MDLYHHYYCTYSNEDSGTIFVTISTYGGLLFEGLPLPMSELNLLTHESPAG